MKNLTINDWEANDKPREKFILKGAESLSNAELIAIILRSGTNELNAIELSRKILISANNKLSILKKYTLEDFKKFKGVGNSKALSIMASFELIKRSEQEEKVELKTIYSSKSASDIIKPILKDLDHEECWILFLNRGNLLISKEKISSGGISATVVDIKIIIKKAINKLASSIILVHNHPSGNINPGEQDKIQTARLKEAAKTCDIDLLDHIIIAGENYFSFLDEGLL